MDVPFSFFFGLDPTTFTSGALASGDYPRFESRSTKRCIVLSFSSILCILIFFLLLVATWIDLSITHLAYRGRM